MCNAVSFVKSTRTMFKKNKKFIWEQIKLKLVQSFAFIHGLYSSDCLPDCDIVINWIVTSGLTTIVTTIGPLMIHTNLFSALCVLQHLQ